MGKRRQTHDHGDQFGETGSGQDRDPFPVGSGRGTGRGGGSAGSSKSAMNMTVHRHVPNFLKPYAHMLGGSGQSEDEPVVAGGAMGAAGHSDSEHDEGGDEEAIQRALEENPELAKELGDAYLSKVHAREEKDKGNKAFAAKRYQESIVNYSKSIELDPMCELYYSNRSAAYASVDRFEEALADADKAVSLKPRWFKGHARRGAALHGMQQYGDARIAYERALKLEPDDLSLRRALDKAIAMELQHINDKKHVFKKRKPNSNAPLAGANQVSTGSVAKQGAGSNKLLSFNEDGSD